MQMTFRWFGDEKDTVSLDQIRQIPGVAGVVPALHYLPAGEAWPLEDILKKYLPQSKLVPPAQEKTTSSEAVESGVPVRPDLLREAGILEEDGLRYCGNSEELYRSVVAEFLDNAEEMKQKLRQYYSSGDWGNYSILVHSLKSSSRTIGAQALSEAAAALEKAGRESDTETLSRLHEPMMRQYCRLTDVLETWLKPGEQVPDTGEILEFMPE